MKMRHRGSIFPLVLAIMTIGSQSLARPPAPIPEKTLVREVVREFQDHNYKRVIRLYREFAAERPDRYLPVIVKVLYSQSLADTGEIDAAIDSLKGLLSEIPPEVDSLQLHDDLANLLFLQKRFEEAREVYGRLILRANEAERVIAKARERLDLMKGKDTNARGNAYSSLDLMELEATIDAGGIPEDAAPFLERIIGRDPNSPQAEHARRLRARLKEVRTQKARSLLNEARRLFDEERNYLEVRELLNEIRRSYADVCEKPSVDALMKEVDIRLQKKP